jgi:hypothetical protein
MTDENEDNRPARVAADTASLPTRYEPRDLGQLKTLSQIVVSSNLAPRHVKRWEDAFLIMKRGAELGLTTQVALENIYVIGGKTAMYADLAIALIKRAGHRFDVVESTDAKAIVSTVRKGREPDGETYSSGRPFEYTIQIARAAGWTKNSMYDTIPRNMLLARAKMELARMVYEDLLAGLYDPTELVELAPAEIVRDVGERYGATDATQAPPFDKAAPDVVDAEFEPAEAQDDGEAADPGELDEWQTANRRFWAIANENVDADTATEFHNAMKAFLGVGSTKDADVARYHRALNAVSNAPNVAEAIEAMIALWLHEDGTPRTADEVAAIKAADAEAANG